VRVTTWFNQRQAVQLRQHAVDDERVVVFLARQVQAVVAARRDVGRMPGLAEAFFYVRRGGRVVFDDEYAHER